MSNNQRFRFSQTNGRRGFFANVTTACIGFSLCNTWIAVLVWSPVFSKAGAYTDESMHMFRMAFFVFDIVAALILKLISDTVAPKRIQFALMPIGILCAIPLSFSALPSVGHAIESNNLLLFAAWAMSGVSVAAVCASWSYYLKPSTYHANLCNSATPFIVSGTTFVVMQFLDPIAAGVIAAVLPLGSVTLWYWCHFKEKKQATSPEKADWLIHESNENSVKDVLELPRSNFLLFTYATGGIIGFTGALGTMGMYSDWVFLFIGLSHIAAGLLVYALLSKVTIYPPKWFFVILLPLATVCLYATSVAPATALVVLCLFTLFAISAVYHIIEQVFTSKFDINRKRLAYSYFNRDRIVNTFGMLTGWFIFALDAFGPLAQSINSFFLLSVLLFVAFFFIVAPLIGSDKADIPSDHDEHPELFGYALDALFSEYGISKREQEVFLLLLEGKNRQGIHEELGISTNTARSHTYNIYRKMGVHSQIELIDLAKAAVKAKR